MHHALWDLAKAIQHRFDRKLRRLFTVLVPTNAIRQHKDPTLRLDLSS